jgi:Ca-activated chloride channel family protein
MSFIWPLMLLWLLAVPVAAAGYLRLSRARLRRMAQLAPLGLVETGSRRPLGRRRHLPFCLFLSAVALLVVGFSRPEVVIGLPRTEGTVILAFDVSNSMLADDLEPTRIEAAKEAARRFVDGQPSTIRIGVVAFSDGGLITQPPTSERDEVVAAIDRLSPQGGTSLSQGIFTSLNAIAGGVVGADAAGTGALDPLPEPSDLADLDLDLDLDLDDLDLDFGYHGSAVVVLLSDGEDTTGLDPLLMSDLAATAGVRVFPIGIGSPQGTLVELDGFTIATMLDESTLREIAASTSGSYFHAGDATELSTIYETIDLELTIRGEKTEITGLLAGAAVVLLLAGAGLSMAWFGRVP